MIYTIPKSKYSDYDVNYMLEMRRGSLYSIIVIGVLGAIGVALGIFLTSPSEAAFYTEDVRFSASDGIRISANFYASETGQGRFKALILIHEFDGNRHDWDRYIPRFIEEGYAVLTYDIRGFGESQSVPRSDDYYDTLTRDLEGAISWLKQQPNVDPDRIGIIGAQLGADVAFISSALFDDIKTTVAISPGNVEIDANQPDLHPHDILVMTTDTELVQVRELFEKAVEPKELRVYRPESPSVKALGIALLFRDIRALDDLVNYLNANL